MNMKKCIALMLVAVVITTMGGEVESVSCEIKCMLKCGGLLVPENTCIEPCMRAQCHKPPRLSCWDKCLFLCGLSLSSQKTCTDKCKKKCHISYVFPSQ
ncbi:plant thionin family protein [Arabidopsis thaliana]|uniref:Plant thionin family protein n=1 Tax=Arabidopsis thaliana TaxID=3702 RepID=A8MS58_ARATH|nr:plant thionin family protein [Arabidopsis thaliana]AEE78382.1 plant thionin family protein [Arabidopsis thaliana]|eukprot:NP_001078256.1 plant thionin family protein [Arabidopsis thaliana]